MVPLFITTLGISIVGISVLLGAKYWELSTGRFIASGVRPKVSRFSHTILVWVERVIPTLVRIYSRRTVRATLVVIHRSAAELVLRTEHMLEHALQKLRHTTDVRRLSAHKGARGEASVFLREVAEHKKKLLRVRKDI